MSLDEVDYIEQKIVGVQLRMRVGVIDHDTKQIDVLRYYPIDALVRIPQHLRFNCIQFVALREDTQNWEVLHELISGHYFENPGEEFYEVYSKPEFVEALASTAKEREEFRRAHGTDSTG